MKTFATACLIASSAAMTISKEEPMQLAQVTSQAHFNDWEVVGATTYEDIVDILYILGASQHDSWTVQTDATKRNLWFYMEKLNGSLETVKSQTA